MAFANEGVTAKLEIVRNVSAVVLYWPKPAGALVDTSVQTATVYEVSGTAIISPTVTKNADLSLQFSWTPATTLILTEDYWYDINYTAGGAAYSDRVYFDVVRVKLHCAIDQNQLQAIEPELSKWLTALGLTSAQQFINNAWDDVVMKIRAAGNRPALITDRQKFAQPARYLALAHIFAALSAKGTTFADKRDWYWKQFETSWDRLGALKFDYQEQTGRPFEKSTIAQPRWRF